MVKKRESGRKISYRQARKFILIVVEGKETEVIYFNSLKQYLKLASLSVEVASSKYSNPLGVVNHALFLQEQRQKLSNDGLKLPYDEIYCVFDGNHPDKQNYNNAIVQSKKHKFNVIISIPCFEIWFLLHFQYSTQVFQNCDEVGKKLKNHVAYYEKSLNIFPIIFDKIEIAINNAYQLVKHHQGAESNNLRNPSTDTHQLVERLFQEKEFKGTR